MAGAKIVERDTDALSMRRFVVSAVRCSPPMSAVSITSSVILHLGSARYL